MAAIHFICRRSGARLEGLAPVDATKNLYRSCCWDISAEDAASLVGGWIYLHAKRSAPSRFGGIITGFERMVLAEKGHPNRIAFSVEARPEGRGKKWRGADHRMAWQSGVVASNYDHESV